MSQEDQATSIGKLVLEYIASKQKLAAIEAEVARAADQHSEAAKILRDNPTEFGLPNQFLGLLSDVKLRQLTTDLRSEM